MPELPEVETTRQGLLPHLRGQCISRVDVRNPSLRWPVSSEVIALHDAPILNLSRRGKYLLFDLPDGQMLVHLGMSGSLRVLPQTAAAGKHDHIDWLLTNGRCIRFNDPRRFGSVLWNSQGASHPLLARMGVEPLTDALSGGYLAQQAKGKKRAVKSFLMDNHVVVGVGNIYAQESLFLAGIHPLRAVNRIAIARWQALAEVIKLVLNNALTAGGTTLRDFSHADGKPGYFQQQLNVYGRGGEACRRCGTAIKLIRQGQRSTCYCPRCQH